MAAAASGVLGATASCFGKFAFDPDSVVASVVHQTFCKISNNDNQSTALFQFQWVSSDITALFQQYDICTWICSVFLARGLCLVAMLLCNAAMLGTFLRGLEESGSVAGTALSTAFNFFASAAYGYFLWGERFSPTWWAGFTMVTSGMMLLLLSSSNSAKGNDIPKQPTTESSHEKID